MVTLLLLANLRKTSHNAPGEGMGNRTIWVKPGVENGNGYPHGLTRGHEYS
jgi:hypothetical protein